MIKVLYRTYFWLIAIPLYAVATFATALITAVGCLLGGEKFFSYYPGALWARVACIVTLCPVRVRGRENLKKGQSYVFISNHQGAFDIFLIYGYLGAPIKWMMRKGVAKIPFVGFACRMAGFILVDNTSARAAQRSVTEAGARLRNGRSLIIFPEGSRSHDGRLSRFKRGAYQIATEHQLPIAPITLNGPFHVNRSGSWAFSPHRLEMIIHPPVMPPQKTDATKEAIQELLDETQQTIHSALWDEFK
ncbi:MAG: 1-acyl-sn-glycerol-3-phosphate acyltransferase [Tannerella sp.]|jgi:1-acyl-sn-glycerol-3-phosphate acyltransferase|nr:1-acyl-sn-glycerol-3-phosphate acyltransferase [Tannerella sp.]